MPDDRLPVVHDVRSDVGIRIASLFDDRSRECVVDAQTAVVSPLQFQSSAAHAFPVAAFARRTVLEKSVAPVVVARHGDAEVGTDAFVTRSAQSAGIAAGVFHADADALVLQRREGVDVDDTAHRVAPIEGRLGASQHFDAFGIGEFHVEIVLLHHRYIVNV